MFLRGITHGPPLSLGFNRQLSRAGYQTLGKTPCRVRTGRLVPWSIRKDGTGKHADLKSRLRGVHFQLE
jgi:hypothetical protein